MRRRIFAVFAAIACFTPLSQDARGAEVRVSPFLSFINTAFENASPLNWEVDE